MSPQSVAPKDYGIPGPLLTVNDVARLLVVSRPTVYALLRKGELRSLRVGERLRFRPDDIDAYLESRRQT